MDLELYQILLLVNAALGLLLLAIGWRQAKPLMNSTEERDSQVPAYRRLDVKRWRFWALSIGAMIWLVPRFILLIFFHLQLLFFVKISTIGYTFEANKPLGKCRLAFFNGMYWFAVVINLMIAGFMHQEEEVDVDYSYYLGKNYKQTQQPPKRISMHISNHSSWMDVYHITRTKFRPCYTPKDELKNIPIVGTLCKGLQCVFVDRAGSDADRQKIVDTITERQAQIEEGIPFSPICMFPEGGTSNGQYLLPFKRGPFVSLKPIQPLILKYNLSGMVSPAYDVIPFFSLLVFQLSYGLYSCTVKILPPFIPNEYLFETHKDKGNSKWEIYAWALREIMAKEGDLEKNDQPYRYKIEYENEVFGTHMKTNKPLDPNAYSPDRKTQNGNSLTQPLLLNTEGSENKV